jgi:hypothetical protein
MSWITPSTDDLKGKLLPQVVNLIANYSAKSGDTAAAVLARELANAVTKVRGYVQGNANNVVGEAGTIPDELTDATLVVARNNVMLNVPGLSALIDQGMEKQLSDAMSLLKDVAAGRFRIIGPDVAAAKQPVGAGIQVVTPARRNNDVTGASGLL